MDFGTRRGRGWSYAGSLAIAPRRCVSRSQSSREVMSTPNTITVNPVNVRAAIDVSLDEKVLPDAIIQLDIYQGAAILDVQQAYPAWETATGIAAQRLNSAADFFTASRVVWAVPALKAENYPQGEGYTREAMDPELIWGRLQALAQDQINAAEGGDLPPQPGSSLESRPEMFGLA